MTSEKQERSLVLVVGAGASKEANLPIGAELKTQIADALNIYYESGFRRVSGDTLVEDALKNIASASESGRRDVEPYIKAGWRIRDAMPQAISIDNFIDSHRGDRLIATCGKLAIARCILDAESSSLLRVDRSNIYNKLDFAGAASTWFNAFFQLLTENCEQSDLDSRFSKLSIICFNYDRCIEHYLHYSLQNYYSMSPDQASQLMGCLEIHHPYGTVGLLPWQDRSSGIDYGAKPTLHQLVTLSQGIRTFTEGTDEKTSDISAIRETLAEAQRICFLGFAFHTLNLELLFGTPNEALPSRRIPVYATAMGISTPDTATIARELNQLAGLDSGSIQINNRLSCSGLFREYWRSLSLR